MACSCVISIEAATPLPATPQQKTSRRSGRQHVAVVAAHGGRPVLVGHHPRSGLERLARQQPLLDADRELEIPLEPLLLGRREVVEAQSHERIRQQPFGLDRVVAGLAQPERAWLMRSSAASTSASSDRGTAASGWRMTPTADSAADQLLTQRPNPSSALDVLVYADHGAAAAPRQGALPGCCLGAAPPRCRARGSARVVATGGIPGYCAEECAFRSECPRAPAGCASSGPFPRGSSLPPGCS